eukprot:CAMPEP_0115544584 /NCGR_PEP_ID=MMETSP0271-20121206/92164_1 /TAXON_ID=71861 /ORGANISM="Scrippsiella trochoidea, Strain CCMP3099" /LENGTH=190 /DNA_ID=CAMNT_0002977905 /DNA_START=58 /DNA_END=630 /DNA_ORIENTATION=+
MPGHLSLLRRLPIACNLVRTVGDIEVRSSEVLPHCVSVALGLLVWWWWGEAELLLRFASGTRRITQADAGLAQLRAQRLEPLRLLAAELVTGVFGHLCRHDRLPRTARLPLRNSQVDMGAPQFLDLLDIQHRRGCPVMRLVPQLGLCPGPTAITVTDLPVYSSEVSLRVDGVRVRLALTRPVEILDPCQA